MVDEYMYHGTVFGRKEMQLWELSWVQTELYIYIGGHLSRVCTKSDDILVNYNYNYNYNAL